MLYKFKSKAAGDVIMLGPSGDQVLRIVGREPAPKGIFEVDHMPALIAALEAAVAADDARREQQGAEDDAARGKGDGVSLRQRAWPLVEMLRRCHAAREVITWGPDVKLWSDSWTNGDRIGERFAAGRIDGSGVGFSDNLNPHLAWSDLPTGTRSLVLICHDFDVPSKADDVNQPDREIPSDLPRVDFFHWLLVDLPPSVTHIAEGEFSRGFTARGKAGPATLHGARQGVNDYTGWFAANAEMAGSYFGYDGPFPPFNDSLVHHYVFTLYALDIARLPVEGAFNGAQVRQALGGHVLDAATYSGTYTLNRRLLRP